MSDDSITMWSGHQLPEPMPKAGDLVRVEDESGWAAHFIVSSFIRDDEGSGGTVSTIGDPEDGDEAEDLR